MVSTTRLNVGVPDIVLESGAAMARVKEPNKVAVGSLLRLCATFTLFGDFTVDKVLADVAWMSMQRDLDVVELWSGVQSIVNAALKKGLQAVPYDKGRVPGETDVKEDITSSILRLASTKRRT